MNSKTFLIICLVIVGVVIALALVTSAIIYEEDITKFLESKTISFGISESSIPLPSEKNMTFIGSYETTIPFYGESGIYNRINIIHDNKRNVTCYLYDDGISCIPDCYIENHDK